MCFNTTKSARAKIAKTDIECWKCLLKDYTNLYRYAIGRVIIYKKGVKQLLVSIKKERIYNDTERIIDEGYHSFKDKICANKLKREYPSIGFRKDIIIKKFIIPIGTRYFENETEYVSETIMLVE
jgi:hypothetical protein